MINVEVKRGANENNVSLIKRFTKRVQGAGILRKVRSLRYKDRNVSPYGKKKQMLKRIEREKVREKLLRLGKIAPRQTR
ncbi:MAG: hypothetical protein Q7S15_01360 [bacterium]|nr:hypothetical protein [bacterium]